MSFIRFKQSISDFVRSKKMKRTRASSSMDRVPPSSASDPGVAKDIEYALLGDLHSAYHEPVTLDVHRSIKHGLNTPPQVSVFVRPASIHMASPQIRANLILEPLEPAQDFAFVPRTPLLPSTPIFENSSTISSDRPSSPYTPSLTYSTPLLSTPKSDVSSVSLRGPQIEDFELLKFLSQGSCGQVHLAKDRVSDTMVALKVMKKDCETFDMPLLKEMLVQEKDIMVKLQGCEWFVQLQASWYDSNNIYFAMTFYSTDLESEIIRCGELLPGRARFYMAEMIIALEELHKHGIVHRDIKAANVLIRDDGHIVLADFGLSKDFQRKPTVAERSYQPFWPFNADDDVSATPHRSPAELIFVTDDICGSEVEIAPEIVLEEYYSFGVDFWSAGITLYFMVTGRHPWSEDKEKSIQRQILEDEIEFTSEDKVTEECKDFIRQMLWKDPSERLRIGLDMTSHPYFAGLDWVAMKNRTISPPWVPHFVYGHFYCEEWGAVELFEPGCALDTEDELLPNFSFTVPERQRSVETPLGNFFRYGSEDQFDDDDDVHTPDFEGDNTPYEVVPATGKIKVSSPTISESDSHASVSPSLHSASSLFKLKGMEGRNCSTFSISADMTCIVPEHRTRPSMTKADLASLNDNKETEWDVAVPWAPSQRLLSAGPAIPVGYKPSRLFEPVLDTVMEISEFRADFDSESLTNHGNPFQRGVEDLVRARELLKKVVTWLTSILPWKSQRGRNATLFSEGASFWKTIKRNIKNLVVKLQHAE